MRRRALLQRAAASAAGLAFTTRLFASTSASNPGDAKFLLVFLRGGYDAASLLVPISSSFYLESRPNIAIRRPGEAADAALPLSAHWGLHPALKDTIFPMVQRGHVAFVPFAGTHDTSRSHFETQDSIELGQAIDGRRDHGSGFMNRLAAVLGARESLSFTDQLPLAFRGATHVGNVSLRSVGKGGLDPKSRSLLADMYRHQPLAAEVQEGFEVRDQVTREMADEMEAASRNAISAKGFELEGRRVAKMMRERVSLGFIDVGGWDTHVNQGAGAGYLAARLDELGRGLATFAEELGDSTWHRTVVVVLSEFGRTLRENGNRGTDHGHGSVHWILGGGLTGASVAGEQVEVRPRDLFQNRDYPVLNEYRAVLGGLFQRQFALSTSALAHVLPGATPVDLRVL